MVEGSGCEKENMIALKPAVSGLRIFGHHVLKTVLFLGYCRWHINGGKSVATNLKRSSKIYKAVV